MTTRRISLASGWISVGMTNMPRFFCFCFFVCFFVLTDSSSGFCRFFFSLFSFPRSVSFFPPRTFSFCGKLNAVRNSGLPVPPDLNVFGLKEIADVTEEPLKGWCAGTLSSAISEDIKKELFLFFSFCNPIVFCLRVWPGVWTALLNRIAHCCHQIWVETQRYRQPTQNISFITKQQLLFLEKPLKVLCRNPTDQSFCIRKQ